MERSNQGVRPPGRRRGNKSRPSLLVTRANAEASSGHTGLTRSVDQLVLQASSNHCNHTGLTRSVDQLVLQGTVADARNEDEGAAAAVAESLSTVHENGVNGLKHNPTRLHRLLQKDPSLEEVQSLVKATPKTLFARDARDQFPIQIAMACGKYGKSSPRVVAYLHKQYPVPVLVSLVNTISTYGHAQTAKQAVAAWIESADERNQHSSHEVQLAKVFIDGLQKASPFGAQKALIFCALLDLNDLSFTRTSQRTGKDNKPAFRYFTFVQDTAELLFEASLREFPYVNMTFLGKGGLKVVEKGEPVHTERSNEEAVVIWDLEEACNEELKELDIYCMLNLLHTSCFLRVHDITLTSYLHKIRTSMELANMGDAGYYVASHDMSSDQVQSVFAQVLLALQLAYEEINLIHYDLKLGNILVHEVTGNECIEVHVGGATFKVVLKTGDLAAKPNDFGTSRTDSLPDENDCCNKGCYNPRGKTAKTLLSLDDDTLDGMRIDTEMYFSIIFAATPGYAAMEMLYRGDNACLDQTIDSHHLGYCLFHLGTGKDFLKSVPVACPKGLNHSLWEFWKNSGRFSMLCQWCSEYESNETFYPDLLYRHLVVFGSLGGEEESEVANIIHSSFSNNPGDWKQYTEDRCLYSIDTGTALQAAREKWTPAGIDLIKGLCHVNPDKRTTLLEALHLPYMARFKTTMD